MDPRLKDMLDRHDIWQVMLRYSRGIDRFDRDMLRSCYHDDAVDDHGAFIGTPEAFIDWAMGYHGKNNTVHHHGISNHYCEIDGDTAHSETYYTFMAGNRGRPPQLCMGRYIDRLEKRAGEWRIAGRMCVSELICDLAATPIPEDYAKVIFSNGPSARDSSDASYMRPLKVRQPG